MAIVTIEVIQTDINEGQIDCQFCPVALAVRRKVLELYSISPLITVDENNIHIGAWMVATPFEAQRFIDAFDDNDVDTRPGPLAFPLEFPNDINAFLGATV